LEYPGDSRLFRFDRDGAPAILTGPLLNDYIGQHLGEGFTTKDFRTWGGTLAAAVALAEHGPPESSASERRVLAAVMRRVGDELGNTASVARSSYVSPAIIVQWRDGRVLDRRFVRRRRSIGSGLRAGLLAEEKALLTLLRSWQSRRPRPG
jgi:DNA topoisomerase-1